MEEAGGGYNAAKVPNLRKSHSHKRKGSPV